MTTKTAKKVATKKADKPAQESIFVKQLDYDGEIEQIDAAIYSHKVTCIEKDCTQVRYCKPQDAFQVHRCKPHARKHTRSNRGKNAKAGGKAARRSAKAKQATANGASSPAASAS